MTIDEIIQDCGPVLITGDKGTAVTSICSDSRKVTAGSVFIAVKGFAGDGHDFIAGALQKGASAVVYEDEDALAAQVRKAFGQDTGPEQAAAREGVTFVRTGSSRHALAIMASNFYGRPSEKLTLVGITGTNGKTTTVTLLYHMFTGLGYSCGLLSTIANYVGSKRYEAVNTTSDPITINSLLAEMADAGCGYCLRIDASCKRCSAILSAFSVLPPNSIATEAGASSRASSVSLANKSSWLFLSSIYDSNPFDRKRYILRKL